MSYHAHLTLSELNTLKHALEAEAAFCHAVSPADAAATEQELASLQDELTQRQQTLAHMLAVGSS